MQGGGSKISSLGIFEILAVKVPGIGGTVGPEITGL
jgi:hypothetical protein